MCHHGAGWQAEERDAHGHLQAHPKNFPSGIKSLVDYAHKAGLKLGIYTAMGNGTCADDNHRGQALGLGCDFTQIPACPRAKMDIDDFVSWGMCEPPPRSSLTAPASLADTVVLHVCYTYAATTETTSRWTDVGSLIRST